jgi:hypothetical protein
MGYFPDDCETLTIQWGNTSATSRGKCQVKNCVTLPQDNFLSSQPTVRAYVTRRYQKIAEMNEIEKRTHSNWKTIPWRPAEMKKKLNQKFNI